MRTLVTALAFVASTSLAAHAAPPEPHWDLARAVIRYQDPSAIRELVDLLHGRPEEAARAAKVIRVIGVGHPTVFVSILSRVDIDDGARAAVLADIASMPTRSPNRARLLAAAQLAESVADSKRAP